MKKRILFVPALILPYYIIFLLVCLVNETLSKIFITNSLISPIIIVIALIFITIVTTILGVILYINDNGDANEYARMNMIFKIVHIPAYFFFSIVGILVSLSFIVIPMFPIAFLVGLNIFFIFGFFNILTMFLTGLIGLLVAKKCYGAKKIDIYQFIIFSILQFIFCIDIAICIALYIKSKKNIEEVKQNV